MGHVLFLLEPLAEVARANRFWMTWNLILAAVPLVLAVPVFRWAGRRGVVWWAGLALVALFLWRPTSCAPSVSCSAGWPASTAGSR
jgi:uncharacterized membrane protein